MAASDERSQASGGSAGARRRGRRWPGSTLWQRIPRAWRPLLLLAPFAAALLARGLLNGAATTPRRPPPLVATASVIQGQLEIGYPVSAEVRPLVSAEVRPEVDGLIQRLYFQEGTEVQRGQPLALINPSPYRVALDQARASSARAQARLLEAIAQERLAAAQLRLASARAQRYGGLSRQGALSRDDEENYTTQQQVAEANLAAQAGAVASARADLTAARAAEAAARLDLEHTVVRAPISGRIGQQRINPGNLVRAQENRPLVVINQISPLDVVFAIPQSRKDQVQPGQILRFAARPALQGRVLSLDNTTNASTGTVMVKARLSGATTSLTPGQSLEGRLLLRRLSQALLVPDTAIQPGQQGPFVYAVRSGRAALVPVTVLGRERGRSAVTGALQAGEPVVVAGQFGLVPGGRLRTAAATAASRGR